MQMVGRMLGVVRGPRQQSSQQQLVLALLQAAAFTVNAAVQRVARRRLHGASRFQFRAIVYAVALSRRLTSLCVKPLRSGAEHHGHGPAVLRRRDPTTRALHVSYQTLSKHSIPTIQILDEKQKITY